MSGFQVGKPVKFLTALGIWKQGVVAECFDSGLFLIRAQDGQTFVCEPAGMRASQ